MATLEAIEKLAKMYAERREALGREVQTLTARIEELKARRRPWLNKLVDAAAGAAADLREAVFAAPELFQRPRTRVLHDIKLGWQKSKGVLEWEDESQVIRLIKKHFPERAEALILTTETPSKTALAQLPAVDLKRLGVTVRETGDQIVVKPVHGEIERLVDALLRDAVRDREEAA
jgi:hypothetical protein